VGGWFRGVVVSFVDCSLKMFTIQCNNYVYVSTLQRCFFSILCILYISTKVGEWREGGSERTNEGEGKGFQFSVFGFRFPVSGFRLRFADSCTFASLGRIRSFVHFVHFVRSFAGVSE